MLRKRAVLAGACLLSVGSAASALGLGEIRVSSSLNQRFEAVIPITSMTADEAESLKASIADNDDFARAGVERSAYLSTVGVETVLEGNNPRLVLRSNQIAHEPLLSIMVAVKAGGPRILREYTIFLDPPRPESNLPPPVAREQPLPQAASPAAVPQAEPPRVVVLPAPATVAAAAAPASTPPAPTPPATPAATRSLPAGAFVDTRPPAPKPTATPSATRALPAGAFVENLPSTAGQPSAGATASSTSLPTATYEPGSPTYGPIYSGETLWGVASRIRPRGSHVTNEQVMLALFQANPTAFNGGDINSMQRHVQFSVPAPEAFEAVDAPTAKARIKSMMGGKSFDEAAALWPAGSAGADAPATAAAAASDPTAAGATTEGAPAMAAPLSGQKPSATDAAPAAGTNADGTPAPTAAATSQPAPDTTTAAPKLSMPTASSAEGAASPPAPTPRAPTPPAPVESPDSSVQGKVKALLENPLVGSLVVPGLVVVVLIGLLLWAARALRERRAQREYEEAARAQAKVAAARAAAMADAAPVMSARDELEEVERRLAEEDEAARVALAPGAVSAVPGDSAPVPGNDAIDAGRRVPPFVASGETAASEVAHAVEAGPYVEPFRGVDAGSAGGSSTAVFELKAPFDAGMPRLEPEPDDRPAASSPSGGKFDDELKLDLGLDPPSSAQAPAAASVAANPAPPSIDFTLDDVEVAAPKARVDDGLDFSLEELELPSTLDKAAPALDPDAPLDFDLGEFDLGGSAPTIDAPSSRTPEPSALTLKEFDLGPAFDAAPPRGEFELRLHDVESADGHDEAISDGDDTATKLDLARAYVEMGDAEMARALLDEVGTQGSDEQKRDAARLRERLA